MELLDLLENQDGLIPLDHACIYEVDFSTILGIEKYEAPLPASLQGMAEGLYPNFIRKTDQERCQNLVREIFGYEPERRYPSDWIDVTVSPPRDGAFILGKNHAGGTWEEQWDESEPIGNMTHWKPVDLMPPRANPADEYEASMKLDGSSMTGFVRVNPDIEAVLHTGVCSRNLELKISEANAGNTFVRVFEDSGLRAALQAYFHETNQQLAVQGEVMGPNIQGNREGLATHEFYLFDVFDITAHAYLDPVRRMEVFNRLLELGAKIKHVPVLYARTTLPALGLKSVSDLLQFAEGPSIKHPVREGLVFKRLDGQFSFKAISQKFLLKESD